MSSTHQSANAVGGKTARACDSCLRRRARWYCAADDAFLCQTCDTSVHSANPLARRHDRVRLKTSSSSSSSTSVVAIAATTTTTLVNSSLPAWHQGFKRKARTPRHAKPLQAASRPVPLVPDLEAFAYDNNNNKEEEEEEEQLLYRVPIFDPVLAEFCSPPPIDDTNQHHFCAEQVKPEVPQPDDYNHRCCDGNFIGFTPSDMDLAEFAADVENLLGQGLDDDSFCIDGLGLMDAREDDGDAERVKMEFSGADMSNNATYQVDMEMELSRDESLDMNFDCGSPTVGDQVEGADRNGITKKVSLRLDYEAVMSAWSCKGCSPWTNGERPQFNLDDCWPDFMGTWGGGGEGHGVYGEVGMGAQITARDGGREARVSRYREKRRTRLFSKKIRYEVRKLNAEKRPRMKGRFVKRASMYPPATAVAPAFPY